MSPRRRTARTAGVLYLVTHVTSVAALALYAPVLNRSDGDLGSGAAGSVLLGGLLEVVLALAVIGTAVALYPIVRPSSTTGAIGYATLRTVEAATILAGTLAVLAVVTLRRDAPSGTGAATLALAAQALVAVHGWSFLIGQGLVVAVHTTMLAWVLHHHALVPRFVTTLGLVGGPLVLASNLGVMFGAWPQASPITAVGAVPVFAWEISLAVVLIVTGLRDGGDSGGPSADADPAHPHVGSAAA